MKQILKIGWRHILLPPGANINSILKALNGAKELEENYHDGKDFYRVKQPVELTIKLVEDQFVLDPNKRKAIPIVTGGPY